MIALLAAGGAAFTNSITGFGSPATRSGYAKSTIIGATATDLHYELSRTASTSTTVDRALWHGDDQHRRRHQGRLQRDSRTITCTAGSLDSGGNTSSRATSPTARLDRTARALRSTTANELDAARSPTHLSGSASNSHRASVWESAALGRALPRAFLRTSRMNRHREEATPTTLLSAHRPLLVLAAVAWHLPRPVEHRWLDPVRGHQRRQHAAAIPHRRPGDRPACLELPGRGDRRVSQHAAAPDGAPPHHRDATATATSSRETTTTSSIRSIPPAPSSSASCGSTCRTAASSSRRCTHPRAPPSLVCGCSDCSLLFGFGEKRRAAQAPAAGTHPDLAAKDHHS